MKNLIDKKIPIGLNISKAIRYANNGNKSHACGLLNEVEREILDKKKYNYYSLLKLINLIRDRFQLNENFEIISENEINDGKIGAYVAAQLAGVSLVTCSRNRTENLLKALPTWLEHQIIREVIIVDWTSDACVREKLDVNGFKDKRIKVIRVEKEDKWVLSYAFNLGFRLAKHEIIIKVDADITLKDDFFNKNKLENGCFIAGDWAKADKGQEHINGFFYIHTNELMRIKGFNEYITTYGWDDDDLYSRLINSGIKRTCVDVNSLYHIPHDDASRLEGIEKKGINAWEELQGDPLFKIRANRYLATVMPEWNKDRTFVPFKILNNKLGNLTVERNLQEMPHYVSKSMRLEAEYYSATEIISWRIGAEVFHLEKNQLNKLISTKKINEISQFDIDIILSNEEESLKIKRHSIYLEFELKKVDPKYENLINIINHISKNEDVKIYISSYGNGSEEFATRLGQKVTRLKRWVRTSGLKIINKENFDNWNQLVMEGSGYHIKITEELLDYIERKKINLVFKKDRMYIDLQHGLGNRLRAFASAAAIAKAVERELVVIWEPDAHCNCRFSDLYNYGGAIIESHNEIPKEIKKYNYMENEEGSEKNAEIIFENGKDLLVRSAFILNHKASNWEHENLELKKLKINEKIIELANSIEIPSNSIGLHVRMEAGKNRDHNIYDSQINWSKESHEKLHYWREKSNYINFIKRVEEIIEIETINKIYLATDLSENYLIFKEKYKDKIIYLQRDKYDRSKEQIEYALADIILLTRTKLFLGSTWSSFSELVLRMSPVGQKHEMSGVDF